MQAYRSERTNPLSSLNVKGHSRGAFESNWLRFGFTKINEKKTARTALTPEKARRSCAEIANKHAAAEGWHEFITLTAAAIA
jgi:hypothetical protein